MSEIDSIYFTDKEILEELRKLGITDVSREKFEEMKQDLINMVSSEISDLGISDKDIKSSVGSERDNISFSSVKKSLFQEGHSFSRSPEIGLRRNVSKNFRYTSKSSRVYSSSTNNSVSSSDLPSSTPNLPSIYEKYLTDSENKNSEQFYTEEEKLETGYQSFPSHEERLRASYQSLPQLDEHSQTSRIAYMKQKDERLPGVQTSKDIYKGIDSLEINDYPRTQSLLGDYRKRLINYKMGNRLRKKINENAATDSSNDTSSKNETSLNSTVIDGKLKRKILRYKNGKPVVTEELVDIPDIYSSCYPSSLTTTNSFSSDLSFQSNSSTGSLVAISPESTPRSTLSNASKVSKPHHKKKSDPVAMYNYYKKFWDNFKPPGEKTHQKLRWAVRDKMMDYSL